MSHILILHAGWCLRKKTLWKNDGVNVSDDDDIPNWKETYLFQKVIFILVMFQSTNQ